MNVVTLGEVLLRLTPAQLLSEGGTCSVCFGGGEANVAAALAGMGIPVRHITALPENDLGRAALADLRKCGIDVGHILLRKGRMGLYFYEAGSSLRAGKVLYDRENSAFALTPCSEYPLARALEGGSWLHLSGITPALGEQARLLTFAAADMAHELGMTVSLDVNYRAALWGREEAERTLRALMPKVDVCIASSHGTDILGVRGGGTDPAECERAARELKEKYGCRTVALTVRDSLSADVNVLSGVLLGEELYRSREFRVELTERVGGGDAFCAGLIYALLKGLDGGQAVELAAAAEAMKHTLRGDKMCVPVEELFALLSGDTRIRR